MRLAGLLVVIAVAVFVALQTAVGRTIWQFAADSRTEVRKVVWPTRQETTQTAIAVFVFTLIMAVFFWLLDSGLLWLTRQFVG